MATNKKPIDSYHLQMLQLIMSDPRIQNNLLMDGSKTIKVGYDGTVLIGRHKYGWVNKWFNSYYVIDFFSLIQRIAFIITGVESNNCDKSGLVGFLTEAIDKVLKKDEKEKVIELLLYYCTLLDENSPLKLTYDITKDDPGFDKNMGNNSKRRKMVGVANACIDFGYERIPVSLHVEGDL